jgi:long-chain acyl-CoA synthetase
MALEDHLRRSREADPGQVALVADARRWSYLELDEVSDRVAAGLGRLGVQAGDRVALQLSNCPELVITYYACFKLGAIAVPVNNRFAQPEIEYTLNHSASRVCISQADLYRNVEPMRSSLSAVEHFFLVDPAGVSSVREFAELSDAPADGFAFPDVPDAAVAAILYTSGTTSRPKGVTHTHQSLSATAGCHGEHTGVRSDDVICIVPPLCHIFGFATQMVTGILNGARLVLIGRFEPEQVLRTIEEHRATRVVGLPTMLQALVDHPRARQYSLRSLRTCIGGGDAVPVALQERFRERFGIDVLEGCGMTEVIPLTLNVPGAHRPGSIGKACPGMTIRLVDDAGRDVAPGTVGEIWVASEGAMIGYWQEPEISAATIVDGYVRTGDLARVDEDGFYWFMGRKKEIIIRGGSNISPLEVEEVLYQHPAVRECGVVGVPDAAMGEAVWAFVALVEGRAATVEELKEFLGGKLAAYKVPESIEFLGELPKGATGKVHRRTLRDRAMSGMQAASPTT